MRMLWKCMISASNHCEVDWQRSSTQDLFNAIIYSAGRGRPRITDTGVCSNSIESATLTNRKLRWLDSWALWDFDVHFRCTSAHFAVALPPAVTGGRERASQRSTRFATLYTDVYWRLRQVSERDGLIENWTAKIDSFRILLIILLYYWITIYVIFVRIWQHCHMWSVVCKQCMLTNALRFFADLLHIQIKWTTNVVLSYNLQNASEWERWSIWKLNCKNCISVASTASAVSEVVVLHRRYAGVFACIVSVCSAHD